MVCVTDPRGGELAFEYDSQSPFVVKAIDAGGHEYAYSYNGASAGCTPGGQTSAGCMYVNNLTEITYPDLKNKTYWYNESVNVNGGVACPGTIQVGNGFAHLPGHMTGIVDENGARYATWTYNCGGKATSSQHAGGAEKVTISYAIQSATSISNVITHQVGSSTAPDTTSGYFSYTIVNGVPKFSQLYGRCVECGNTSSASYDARSNMISAKDWNGNLACYAFDLTNLENMRIEGLPGSTVCATALASTSLAAPARRISTQWRVSDRLPTLIAEPLKITTFGYDVAGNQLTRSEQATTDASGVAGVAATRIGPVRTWTNTYNESGQVLTETGPRRDLDDTTTYVYDSNGNLASVTNALRHVTTFTNYDANGHVGRITGFNGVVTDLVYGPRGWLDASNVSAGGATQSTAYEYDGVGQVKKVTFPDSSFISYAYDDAHRLTDITDGIGNTIHYTLDYRGKRIAEQTRDPNGTLARQVSRVFDNLEQLKSVTGGTQ